MTVQGFLDDWGQLLIGIVIGYFIGAFVQTWNLRR